MNRLLISLLLFFVMGLTTLQVAWADTTLAEKLRLTHKLTHQEVILQYQVGIRKNLLHIKVVHLLTPHLQLIITHTLVIQELPLNHQHLVCQQCPRIYV